MTPAERREETWRRLAGPWDLVVVGGGITGAAILREATRTGWKTLLLEQRDFAWGTSSRSSKLVHGGLRYLREGKVQLTRTSVGERERLLREAPGLVEPLDFVLPVMPDDRASRWAYAAGLLVYDALAGRRNHRRLRTAELLAAVPHLDPAGLRGGFRYGDAGTDDARLVLRVIRDAVADGGVALGYAAVETLLRSGGRVAGVGVRDVVSGRTREVPAKVVVNATGAWADRLRGEVGAAPRIRPLRGSHLVFPGARIPMREAIVVPHPEDRRPVFLVPWEGATLLGTTDVDHSFPLDEEPRISTDEAEYLLAAARHWLPSLELGPADVISTYAGVRPVVGTGLDPSRESRDHVVWEEEGMLTVTGGKLTTFRPIALDALQAARHLLPAPDRAAAAGIAATSPGSGAPGAGGGDPRLVGRYGPDARAVIDAAEAGELDLVPGTPGTWAELRWAARSEAVVHLDDLLLRRTRVGLLLPQAGAGALPRIRRVVQEELGWDDARWQREEESYLDLWRTSYTCPALTDDARIHAPMERPA